jgi:hypothetical protein
MNGQEERRPGPRGSFTTELGEAYLALLRETGNARASARALGHPYLFDNRKRYDPAFARACDAAAKAADARLSRAESPFLSPIEVKSMPPPEGDEPVPEPREQAIRRTSNGRTQISYVREGGWTSKIEAAFLARLRETGNFDASAWAVGFNPRTLYTRIDQWAAFARDCAEALEAASVQLDYTLVAHAHALLRRPGEAQAEDGEEDKDEARVPFDPEAAMRILSFIDRRRAGRTTRGHRKGPPARRVEDARASILRKIEAIERHEKMMKERGEDRGQSLPLDGGG